MELTPQRRNHGVHQTRGGGQQAVDQLPHDDPAQEVGQVDDGLYDLLEALRADLVQQQGEDDRHGEAHDQRHEGDDNGVCKDPQEVRMGEHAPEVRQTYPGAAQHAFEDAVVLKGYHTAQCRDDPEQHEEEQTGYYHQIQKRVVSQASPEQ